MRRAIESLIAQHAPKPPPRKASVHVAEAASVAAGRRIVRDKLAPAKLPMPTIHGMHAVVPRPERPRHSLPNSLETQLILDGLSARKPLEAFADDAAFAQELEALARERGLGTAHVLRELDHLAIVVAATPDSQGRKNAVFCAANQAFGEV